MPRQVVIYRLGVLCVGLFVARAACGFPLLAQNWRDLGPKERYDAMQNYRRHEQLPADRQRDIENRYQQWRNMSPDERNRVRQNYERFKQLPPQERERFERKYQKWRRETPPTQ